MLPPRPPRLRRPPLLAAVAILALACSDGTDSTDAPGPKVDDTALPTTSLTCDDADWQATAEPVLATWCTECHSAKLPEGQRGGAPVGVDLDSLDDARTWSARIRARAIDQQDMPPVAPVPWDQLEQLTWWLDCDMPGSTSPDPADPCDAPTERTGDVSSSDLACDGAVALTGSLVVDNATDLSCVCSVAGDLTISTDSTFDALRWVGGTTTVEGDTTQLDAPELTATGDLLVDAPSLGTLTLPELADAGTIDLRAASLTRLELPSLVHATSLAVYDVAPLEALVTWRLTTVDGDLRLERLPSLATLDGANALEWVGGSLVLDELPAWTALHDHNALTTVGADLRIAHTGLARITGLQALETVGGSLVVESNPDLRDALLAPWLTDTGADLVWRDHPQLTSLAGFGTLGTVGGDFVFDDQPLLAQWPAWSTLWSVTGDLQITLHPQLPTSAIAELVDRVDIGGEVVVDEAP